MHPPFFGGAKLEFTLGHRATFHAAAADVVGVAEPALILCSGLNGGMPEVPSHMQEVDVVTITLAGTYGPSASRMYAPEFGGGTRDIDFPRAPIVAHAEFLEMCLDLLHTSYGRGVKTWNGIVSAAMGPGAPFSIPGWADRCELCSSRLSLQSLPRNILLGLLPCP